MFIRIGKLIKVHGVHGHLIADHNLITNIDFGSWDALMIELNPGSFIPYFIEEISEQSPTSFKIKLETIDNPECAKLLTQKNIYASPSMKINTEEVKVEADSFIGYTLYDNDTKVGTIENLLNPALSPLFIINEHTDNEILIPANEELFVSVDRDTLPLIMDLPQGLY
jgi:16S rRNA processing protein RimM